MRDQLPPAQPAVLEVVDHFDDLGLHGRSFTNFEILSRSGSNCLDFVFCCGFATQGQ
jgi:hypothetical protein